MSGAFKSLALELTGTNTGLKSMFADSDRLLSGFEKKVDGSNKKLLSQGNILKGVAAGAAALAGGLAYAITKAVAFDKAMRNVNSLSKLNDQGFKAMEKSVISMSTKLPQSATVLAEGLYDIASSGFQGADGLTVLDAAARSASAGLTTTATSSKAITAVLNAYGLQAKDAADVSDVLFSTVNMGVITFDELANNLGDVVGATSAAKVGIDQVGAAIATMTLSGIKGAQATTALSSLTTKLVQPSAALAKLYKQLGYESGAAALEQKGLRAVMEDVRKATGGNITAMLQLFPDIEAARGALALMTNDGRNYAKVADQITDKTKRMGATQQVLDEQMKAVSNQWQLFTNKIDAAAITVGIKLLPALTQAMGVAQNFGAAIVILGQQIGERAGSGFAALGESADSVVELLKNLGEVALTVAEPLAKLGGGAVIETFNALASVLAKVTGLAADNQTVVLALGAAYAVHAVGGIAAITSGMGIVSNLLVGKFTPGMYDAAEGVLGLGDKAKAAGSKLLAMAPALAVGGALALAITAWASYSKEAGRADEITEKAQASMNSFKLDQLIANLNEARQFVADFQTRMDDFGTHNGFADFVTDIGNASKNWGTLAMAENLDQVQAAAHQTELRIGNLRYNTLALWKALGQKLDTGQMKTFLADVEGANGLEKQTAAAAKMQTTVDKLGPVLQQIGVDMGTAWSADEILRVQAALQGYDATAQSAASAQTTLVEAMGSISQAMGDAEGAAKKLSDALDALMGGAIGMDEATIAWKDGLIDLQKELSKNGSNISLNTEASRANRTAIIGQIKSMKDLLVAAANTGEGASQLSVRMGNARESLIKAGEAAKIPRAEMVKLLAQYKLTPELVQTIIKENGGKDVNSMLKKLQQEADTLDKKKPTPKVDADAKAAAAKLADIKAKIAALDKQTASPSATVRDQASRQIAALRAQLAALDGKTVTTTVVSRFITERITRGQTTSGGGHAVLADGGITRFKADNGKLPQQATIKAGQGQGVFQWAEAETGGEAFIPMAPGKRQRSEQILATVAEDFGLVLMKKFANGGFSYPGFKFSYPKFQYDAYRANRPPSNRTKASMKNYNEGEAHRKKEYIRKRREEYAEWQKKRTEEMRASYAEWKDNRFRALEEWKDRRALLSETRGQSGAGRFTASRDAGESLGNVTSSREAQAQAFAELKARQSVNPHDDAADFYKKPTVSLKEYNSALAQSIKAQGQWNIETTKVGTTIGYDVVNALKSMGDEGEAIIKKLATASVAEMTAMRDKIRALDFSKFVTESAQDAKGQAQFQGNLAALIKMGRADLAAHFSSMGYAAAGGLAAQAIKNPGALAGLAGNLAASDKLSSPDAQKALQLAALLSSGRVLGVNGLATASGTGLADVLGLLQTYNGDIFGKMPAARMAMIRKDQQLINAGKQPTGYAMGAILRGSDTGYHWAERDSGGESLIPHGVDRRRRAIELWRQTGRILSAPMERQSSSIVISPGAVTVQVDASGNNISAQDIEAATRRATTSALQELTRALSTGRRS
jgi:TP901 family phage tail tape measure protein